MINQIRFNKTFSYLFLSTLFLCIAPINSMAQQDPTKPKTPNNVLSDAKLLFEQALFQERNLKDFESARKLYREAFKATKKSETALRKSIEIALKRLQPTSIDQLRAKDEAKVYNLFKRLIESKFQNKSAKEEILRYKDVVADILERPLHGFSFGDKNSGQLFMSRSNSVHYLIDIKTPRAKNILKRGLLKGDLNTQISIVKKLKFLWYSKQSETSEEQAKPWMPVLETLLTKESKELTRTIVSEIADTKLKCAEPLCLKALITYRQSWAYYYFVNNDSSQLVQVFKKVQNTKALAEETADVIIDLLLYDLSNRDIEKIDRVKRLLKLVFSETFSPFRKSAIENHIVKRYIGCSSEALWKNPNLDSSELQSLKQEVIQLLTKHSILYLEQHKITPLGKGPIASERELESQKRRARYLSEMLTTADLKQLTTETSAKQNLTVLWLCGERWTKGTTLVDAEILANCVSRTPDSIEFLPLLLRIIAQYRYFRGRGSKILESTTISPSEFWLESLILLCVEQSLPEQYQHYKSTIRQSQNNSLHYGDLRTILPLLNSQPVLAVLPKLVKKYASHTKYQSQLSLLMKMARNGMLRNLTEADFEKLQSQVAEFLPESRVIQLQEGFLSRRSIASINLKTLRVLNQQTAIDYLFEDTRATMFRLETYPFLIDSLLSKPLYKLQLNSTESSNDGADDDDVEQVIELFNREYATELTKQQMQTLTTALPTLQIRQEKSTLGECLLAYCLSQPDPKNIFFASRSLEICGDKMGEEQKSYWTKQLNSLAILNQVGAKLVLQIQQKGLTPANTTQLLHIASTFESYCKLDKKIRAVLSTHMSSKPGLIEQFYYRCLWNLQLDERVPTSWLLKQNGRGLRFYDQAIPGYNKEWLADFAVLVFYTIMKRKDVSGLQKINAYLSLENIGSHLADKHDLTMDDMLNHGELTFLPGFKDGAFAKQLNSYLEEIVERNQKTQLTQLTNSILAIKQFGFALMNRFPTALFYKVLKPQLDKVWAKLLSQPGQQSIKYVLDWTHDKQLLETCCQHFEKLNEDLQELVLTVFLDNNKTPSVEILRVAANSNSEAVKKNALALITHVEQARALEKRLKVLNGTDTNEEVLPKLLELLDTEQQAQQLAGIKALGALGDVRALPKLVKLAGSNSQAIQAAIFEAIESIKAAKETDSTKNTKEKELSKQSK